MLVVVMFVFWIDFGGWLRLYTWFVLIIIMVVFWVGFEWGLCLNFGWIRVCYVRIFGLLWRMDIFILCVDFYDCYVCISDWF